MEEKKNDSMEVITAPKMISDEELAALSYNAGNNIGFFTKIGQEAGVVDSPLKARQQLATDDILMRVLHLETAHITRAVDPDDGTVSDFPVVAFTEFPNHYYTAGKRLMSMVCAWAESCGDEFKVELKGSTFNFEGDRMLPYLNQAFNQHGAPALVFKWKKGKKQEYVEPVIIGG